MDQLNIVIQNILYKQTLYPRMMADANLEQRINEPFAANKYQVAGWLVDVPFYAQVYRMAISSTSVLSYLSTEGRICSSYSSSHVMYRCPRFSIGHFFLDDFKKCPISNVFKVDPHHIKKRFYIKFLNLIFQEVAEGQTASALATRLQTSPFVATGLEKQLLFSPEHVQMCLPEFDLRNI